MRSRRSLLGVLGATAVAGCLGNRTRTSQASIDGHQAIHNNPPPDEPPNVPPSGDQARPVPMALDEFQTHAVSGGPPKDGIPSIDRPTFASPAEVELLDDQATVLGVATEAQVKAYPRQILVHHEIVNDVIGTTPISLTYCPLTGTGQAFARGQTEFGVSGRLINSNLIMYDRARDRWWPQLPAVSIPGPWNDTPGGVPLREINVVRTTLGRWRKRYPGTQVMTHDTGYTRDYGRDPYADRGYYRLDGTLFDTTHEDNRYHAKHWVYGVRLGASAAAFSREYVHAEGVVPGTLGERPIVAVYDPELETAHIYRNPEERRFRYEDGGIHERAGTTYPPDALPLPKLVAIDAFWFAWAAYYPETAVYDA